MRRYVAKSLSTGTPLFSQVVAPLVVEMLRKGGSDGFNFD
jgi:hypothetical protein